MLNDSNLDAINEVYKNASVALLSISNVVPEITDVELKKEILDEYDGYEKLLGEVTKYMAEKGYEAKEVGMMKKFMMKSGIKMNTAMDDSESNIAQIMIKGTVMGITELCELINNSETVTDKKIIEYAERLKSLEETYEERLKKFL
ncbi:MAG: hypothetical protein IKA85_02425 [Clostridia bacterium]|nr:hypothetical protein [Clostridia bacterium]